jgi:pyruvate formate lyase activating enzyme
MIKPYLNAANIDLKSFSDEFYRKKAGGRLNPVLKNIKKMFEYGIWIEVTTLLIPGENDSDSEIKSIASFLAGISKNIPWHISAYFPQYKSDIPSTEPESVLKAVRFGKEAGLSYVYGGNLRGSGNENTICPDCGKTAIEREGFSTRVNNIKGGKCRFCQNRIEGVFID